MGKNKYQHLQEPIRVKIAIEYLQHEIRKILPGIRSKAIWQAIDKEIANLLHNKTMAPVRDFWNLVDGISFGLKLKNLVASLTSQNIKWSKETIKLDDLSMPAKNDFVTLSKLKIETPSGREVREFLFAKKNQAILKLAKQYTLLHSRKTFARDADSIMVRELGDQLVVLDGNRRMLKGIVAGQSKITAYVGRVVKQPMFYNHWVPTSRMINLAGHARLYLANNDKAAAKCLSQALGHLIKPSAVGQAEFYERVITKTSLSIKKASKFILNEVEKII